ncbi:N-acetylneuraminate synthase [Pseudomonas lopnurensis]|uniref:N-acetylneuraminate synthase n=1 Tax=Pseudomonas lopnurensis TaxID=1477517 RepID=UPI0028A5C456|nr:N-acetylneuraminate synthase [Pseudomonas lopnurensis]
MSVYVIAEAGVNHNGSLALAKELVRVASECGADAVKFQTFITEKLVTRHAKKAEYQKENDASSSTQAEMLKRLELSYEDFSELSEECKKYNIDFMTTCFDSDSLDIICRTTSPKVLKVGSGDLTNLPFLIEHARKGVNVIISTGMATLSEVEDALAALAFGYLTESGTQPKNYRWLKHNYFTAEAIEHIKGKVTILHCVTDYPAQPQDLNLDAIRQLREAYKLHVGYSDHALGMEACCAAVALGATCLEKHITLDKTMTGPDHAASSSPHEFKEFVTAIRNLELALRPKIKAPTKRELANLEVARKYLVAAADIAPGELFTKDNVEIKRSATGMLPNQYWDLLGRPAQKAYRIGESI